MINRNGAFVGADRMSVPLPLALTLAGGSAIIAVVLVVGFFAVVFGWYTRRGSAINQHPYRDLDRNSGPEKPSELAHDTTQDIDNWSRGVGAHRRPRRTPHREQLEDEEVLAALRDWRQGKERPTLTTLDSSVRVRGPESGAEVIVFWDYLAPDAPALAAALAELSQNRPIKEAALHLPVADARPLSLLASLGVEAGAAQGEFWAVHDTFLRRQPTDDRSVLAAAGLVPDPEQFRADVTDGNGRARVLADIRRGQASGVHSVPAVFIGGAPYEGEPDATELAAALDSPAARPWERRIPV